VAVLKGACRRWPLLAALACLAAVPARAGRPEAPSELEVKAAFVYNFGLFVAWPAGPSASGPFTIGLLGDDPLAETMERVLAGRRLGDRDLEVRRLARLKDARDVHILVVCRSEARRLPAVLDALEGLAVLTVSDLEGFARRGGMIGLRVDDRKVGFEVDLERASRSGLSLSSQLLRLARTVKTREAE